MFWRCEPCDFDLGQTYKLKGGAVAFNRVLRALGTQQISCVEADFGVWFHNLLLVEEGKTMLQSAIFGYSVAAVLR